MKKEIIQNKCSYCLEFIPIYSLCPSHYARNRYCSRKCRDKAKSDRGKGYKAITVPGKGVIHEHRHIMEEKLGRRLAPAEHVHHIDGNKRNNAIENLEVLDIAEHTRRHFLKRPETRVCTWCNVKFKNTKPGNKTCSPKCGRAQSEYKRNKVSPSMKICILAMLKRKVLYQRQIASIFGITQTGVSWIHRNTKYETA